MSEQQTRRLKQSLLVSLNGVIGDPATWTGSYFGPKTAQRSLEELQESGAFLMGRGTYDLFSRQWPDASGPYADRLNSMPKYVFSSTLDRTDWSNTTIVSGDVVSEVTALKRQAGRDITFYGHGRFGQTLTDAGLVDELTIIVFPLFVPGGTTLFQPGGSAQTWELVDVREGADSGTAILSYRPAGR